MIEKKSAKENRRVVRQPRASITFPPKLYRALESLAKEKKVSLAWVVREAAEMYVASQPATARQIERGQS
jgi:predicted transcriptional regulator